MTSARFGVKRFLEWDPQIRRDSDKPGTADNPSSPVDQRLSVIFDYLRFFSSESRDATGHPHPQGCKNIPCPVLVVFVTGCEELFLSP